MARNTNGGGDRIPRVYDKSSGEYRPVFEQRTSSDRGGRRNSMYATPQRRAETRKRRRRRALVLFYFFIFVTVVAAAAALSLTVLFKIDTVQVNGNSRYSSQDITRASGIRTGDNLFLANTGAAGRRIQEKFPYLGTVTVSRRFPARIVITVTDVTVGGTLEYKGRYAVISTAGKVLELADKMPKNCTQIKGVKLTQAEVGKNLTYADPSQQSVLQSLTASLSANGMTGVTAIDLTKTYRILVVYDNRITLNLGLASDMDKKFRFAKSILDSGKIKSSEKGVLDLSTSADDDHAYFDPAYSANSS